MTGEHFDRLIVAEPFRPFALSGPMACRAVDHPEAATVSRTGSIIEIERTDESRLFVDLPLVLASKFRRRLPPEVNPTLADAPTSS